MLILVDSFRGSLVPECPSSPRFCFNWRWLNCTSSIQTATIRIPTQFLYRLDALAVTQPTVVKHGAHQQHSCTQMSSGHMPFSRHSLLKILVAEMPLLLANLPTTQPTESEHWLHIIMHETCKKIFCLSHSGSSMYVICSSIVINWHNDAYISGLFCVAYNIYLPVSFQQHLRFPLDDVVAKFDMRRWFAAGFDYLLTCRLEPGK